MKPTIVGSHVPTYSSDNLGTATDEIYYFAYDNVAARQLLDVTITTAEEYSISPGVSLSPLGGARFRQINLDTFAFQFRKGTDGVYSNEIYLDTGDDTRLTIRIAIFNKKSLWASLSECNLEHNVSNNEKFIVKIYRVLFDLSDTQEWLTETIGEFETVAFVASGGDAVGRGYQIKLRVDEIIKNIERPNFAELADNQSFEAALLVMPSIWTYSISNADESEVYDGPFMYTVNCHSNSSWYLTAISYSEVSPIDASYTGRLNQGAILFTDLGNEVQKLVNNSLVASCIFDRAFETNFRFIINDSDYVELATVPFNYSWFYAFENQLKRLPFYFMFLRYNVQDLGLNILDYQSKQFIVRIVNSEEEASAWSAKFIARNFTGNNLGYNDVPFDGFLFEDSLGGFSELPIELKFTGSAEFENTVVVLEKPSTGNINDQRIFPVLDNFNFEQSYEGTSGYFSAAQRNYYQKLLTSKFIIFRRRRIFITSASFVNVDEPNGLFSIKFTFKFADNNPFYDRNYPTA